MSDLERLALGAPTLPKDVKGIVAEMPRPWLVACLESRLPDWNDPTCSRGRVLAACRKELVRRYPCTDCGAEAGKECKPDYGCEHSARRKPLPNDPNRLIKGWGATQHGRTTDD